MKWKKLLEYKKYQARTPTNFIQWEIKKGKVLYSNQSLKGVDMESFEIPENFYDINTLISRDKENVFYGWSKIKKIDRNSFIYLGTNYWQDKNYVYAEYETSLKPLKGLDVRNFKYLGNGFGFDMNYAYYFGIYIKSCKSPTTLRSIKGGKYACFAKDVDNIYYQGAALKNVDIGSWTPIDDFYSQDKKSIFYMKNKLPRVDIDTWEYLGENYSKDKNQVYNMNFVEKDANPNEWNKEKVIEMYNK